MLFRDRIPIDEFEQRVRDFDAAEGEDFARLIAATGLDPRRDLRFGDFAGCRLEGADLGTFDFTGCDLTGATFAREDHGKVVRASILGATFDMASLRLDALKQADDFDKWLAADLARTGRRRLADPARLCDRDAFREAPWTPEMVVIPAGEFWMGSDGGDEEALDAEKGPDGGKRLMRIPERFAIGKYPVTFEEFDLFCDVKGRERPEDRGWGRERRPVICVSWDDANAYADWLNEKLGMEGAYRLPSEAEWEYCCRAGENTRRWWGDAWDPARANGDWKFEGGRTSPVDRFPANPWGLHDTIGKVWEWSADVWTASLSDLPEDGRPFAAFSSRKRKKQNENVNSPERALRGGSWGDNPRDLRSAIRDGSGADDRNYSVGFRLARTL